MPALSPIFTSEAIQFSFHSDLTLTTEIHDGNCGSEYKIRQPFPALSDTKPSNPPKYQKNGVEIKAEAAKIQRESEKTSASDIVPSWPT